MFTNVLNTEEKEKFLELVYKLASCDNDYAEEEKELINSYKRELNITEVPDTSTIDDLIAYFAKKSNDLKRIIFFETYGMLMADGKIDDEETKNYAEIKKEFALGEETYSRLVDAANTLQDAYDKVYDAVFE